MRRIRSHLTFANIAAGLALVIALASGTAYAADTVFSEDIVNGEIKSPDIGNNQVRSVDVRDDGLTDGGLVAADLATGSVAASELATDAIPADGTDGDGSTKLQKGSVGSEELVADSVGSRTVQNDSLTGSEVQTDSLTGSDVLESSLGVVPDADRVDGRHVCRGEASAGTSFTTLCAAGGLIVEGACTPLAAQAAEGIARLRTTQASNAFYVINNGPVNSTDANFRSADGPVTLVSQRGDGAGAVSPTITHFHASSQTGQLTGSIAVRVTAFSSTLASCEFTMDILG